MSFSTILTRSFAVLMTALILSLSVQAQQPSAAQIEQFKQLPRAQQEALAKQYGVDISQLTGNSSANRLQENAVAPLQQAEVKASTNTPRSAPKAAGLPRFGESLFDANISTFSPVANAPVPEKYRLGPDDTLLVQVYGKQNDTYELVVNREGSVNLPDLGPANVAGLTYLEASELIRNRITAANIGLQAAVTMGQLRTINIFVAGEARNPGMYAVSALTSVTQALFVSGGVSDIGSLRDIKVTRSGKTVANFDLYELLLRGQNSNDIILQHGDVLFISPIGTMVTIEGEVQRPAHYELAKSESLNTLIAMAGGLKAGALSNAISVQRTAAAGRELVTVDLSNTSQQNFMLKAGDHVIVSQLSARVLDQVTIAGAVARPGQYAWRQGLHLHDILTNVWSDLINTTDADYALVVRKLNNRGDVDVIQFNLLDALNVNSMPQTPLRLQAQDIVLVFNQGNQSYQRDVLNAHIKNAVEERLAQFNNNALLAGDVAGNFFRNLEGKNASIGASQFTVAEQNLSPSGIVESYIASMLNQMFFDKNYIGLSKHLTRRELLFPLLQMLRKQSNNIQLLPIVSISGDVKVAGEYPLPVNGSVSMLVKAAGGLNSSAFPERAELSRFIQHSGDIKLNQQNINIDLGKMLTDAETDMLLASRDRLNVLTTPDWSHVRLVNVQGEVKFPGTYQVLKGEKLSEVIKRAGGFTSNAYPYGAVFTRENIKRREQEQAERLMQQLRADIASKSLTSSSLVPSASGAPSIAMIQELQAIEPVGRLAIDLESIMMGQTEFDIELDNNDAIFIPRRQNSVTVMGEVQHPGSHRYRSGLNVKDYLSL
ncbi:MAG: SLBB domain-containing protein, partial [Paraglaciecola sp.]|nr:SLBB domain-containing protein [Paraglaciecola sp.]